MLLSPYNLADEESYKSWRNAKLVSFNALDKRSVVNIENPYALSQLEREALMLSCNQNNFVIYQLFDEYTSSKTLVHELGKQLGLQHLDNNLRADEDSVTSLEVREQAGNQYIPYTNKPLSWHCDGYYNDMNHQVRGFIMHCVTPSETGGDNELIDHEILYMKLRDTNPAFIDALMQPDVMTIPANIEEGVEIRAEQSGPVFSVDPATGRLHMRYSARKRNIQWKDNEITQQATVMITKLLSDTSIIVKHKLLAGQGIICNNVLHNRKSFEDSKENKRLMYRARYYDRVMSEVNE